MVTFLCCVLSNVVFAGCLSVFALALTRAWRSPHLAHALWLLVLIKLVTPPIVQLRLDRFMVTSAGESAPSQIAVVSEPSYVPSSPPDGISSPVAAPAIPLSSELGDAPSHHRETSRWDTILAMWPQWLLTAWGIGTVVFISVGLRQHLRLLPLIAGSQAPDPALAQDAEQLARQIGLPECPPLRVTAAHVCPFVAPGMRKPTVVLPRRLLTDLNRDQVKSMLAHELAHIRRRDHWIRVFEVCVLSLNWWNPIAGWARRQLQWAEEECCDAWVVWVLPEKRRVYGQTLLWTIEYVTGESVLAAPAGSSFHSCQLERRIDVVMNRMVGRQMSRPALAFMLTVGLLVLPIGATQGVRADAPAVAPESGDGHVVGSSADATPVDAEASDVGSLSFDGIVFERVLSHGTHRPLFVDLDSGRFMTPPSGLFDAGNRQDFSLAYLTFTAKLKAWIRQQGIDAAVQTDGSSVTIVGIELRVGEMLAPSDGGSELTPRKVVQLVEESGGGKWITCRHTFSDDTYGSVLPFITREGAVGSLYIQGLTDLRGPNSITLRYQIVRPFSAKSQTQQSPEPAILGDFAGFLVVDAKGGDLQLRLPGGRGTITLKEGTLVVSSAAHRDLLAARVNTGRLDIDAVNRRVLVFGRGRQATLRPVGDKVRVEMEDRVADDTKITLLMPELKIYQSLDWKNK